MREAMPYLRGDLQGKVVAITFDDGYADNIDLALPILRHYGHTATCYVVSQSIGLHNTWDSDVIHSHKPLMSKKQLEHWCATGMEVGAHTQTHPRLPSCNKASLVQEVAGSKADLENLLQMPVNQFCYPYGNLDERVVQAVRAAGYEAATTTNPGVANNEDDFHLLPREKMTGYSHLFRALFPSLAR